LEAKGVRFIVNGIADVAGLRTTWFADPWNNAFILVEKLLMSTAGLQRVFTDRYYQMKRDNGYTQEEIDRKRLALEGVQVPVTASWNEQLLHDAGFRQAECFWRWFNFAGWIAVKEG
ncbi:MAG: hypothetical protein ACHQ7M_22785, partial [Chloroflexota bacterium]